MIDESKILGVLERQPKQSAPIKTIFHELGVRGEDERHRVHTLLAEMVANGLLKANSERFMLAGRHAGRRGAEAVRGPSRSATGRLPGDDVRGGAPSRRAAVNRVIGKLSMHRDGFGFVTPNDASWREQLEGDIFIAPPNVGSAMHGDKVLVEVTAIKTGARAEGRILRIVEREHETVVGTFHYGDRFNYVTPMDAKVALDIMVPRGKERPAALDEEGEETRLGQQHRVYGKEAKRKDIDWNNMDGLVVDVEITEWPTATQNPKGRVIEVLGYEDDFGVDVEIIIRKHHIPHRFPLDALDEAQDIDETISQRELRRRRDYRNLPIVTIDGETARDFDDAVFVRRKSNGNFELHVHIADVSQYVLEGSALDAEARRRGNSVYFPDRAVPMLPVELSTNVCSLRPNVDRLVMSCVMEIDHAGEIVAYEINEGVIRSAERMTYTDVNAILQGDMHVRRRYERLIDVFELMRELQMILNRKRVKRGSIDFDLPEPVIEFDEHGLMKSVVRSERNIAHRMIEEFMLAANEAVATYLEEKGVPSLYRIHEKPSPKKVLEFETLAATFGYSLGVGALPVKKFKYIDDRRPRRFEGGGRGRSGAQAKQVEIPEDIHVTPRMYQKLAQKIEGKPEERIVAYLMLRSLKQARYSHVNEGHFALACPTYTHFTSPIRRYPDLIIHRLLKEVLREAAEQQDVTPGTMGGTRSERTVAIGTGSAVTPKKSPWAKDRNEYEPPRRGARDQNEFEHVPIPEDELAMVAEETSDTERRADDAERELMDWKKAQFMHDRIGEEFEGMVTSVTKFGMFVELMDLFIEGLVPLATMEGDKFEFSEDTRQVIGRRTKKAYSLGDRVTVIVDRIDPVEKKITFALVEEEPSRAEKRRKNSKS